MLQYFLASVAAARVKLTCLRLRIMRSWLVLLQVRSRRKVDVSVWFVVRPAQVQATKLPR